MPNIVRRPGRKYRSQVRPAIPYPLPSNCWLCGRFGHGALTYPKRTCERCGVTWFALLPGIGPRDPVVREFELNGMRDRYLKKAHPDLLDIFGDFIDHSREKLPCPA